jgi:hypothetical protein
VSSRFLLGTGRETRVTSGAKSRKGNLILPPNGIDY